MRRGWIVLALLGACGCATPAHVKQAIKLQSDAHLELQGALQDFALQHAALYEQLFRLRREARSNTEMLALIKGLSGGDPQSEGKDTWAAQNTQKVEALAARLDKIPSNHKESLDTYKQVVESFEQAHSYGQEESEKDIQRTRQLVQEVQNSIDNLSRDIRALMMAHDAVASYLDIDLSPNPQQLKDAISNIKALRE